MLSLLIGPDKGTFVHKIVIIFLSFGQNIYLACS